MSTTYDGLTAEQWAAKFHALAAEHAMNLRAIAHKQARERDAWRDEWRTAGPEADPERERLARTFDTYDDATADAKRWPWREVQHRRVTDWRTVRPADTATDQL